MTQLNLALELSQRCGFYVFPCKPDKSPLTPHGRKDASRNHREIEAWWTQHPNALVGVNTGMSGIVVLDIDVKKDKNGYQALKDKGLEIANTFHYSTPNGGEHWVYEEPRSKSIRQSTNLDNMQGVDRQSGDSYAIWYTSDTPWESELSKPPVWLTSFYASTSEYPDAEAYEGTWNDFGWSHNDSGLASQKVVELEALIKSTPHIGNGELLNLTMQVAYTIEEGHPQSVILIEKLRKKYYATTNESEANAEKEFERLMRGALGKALAAKKAGDLTPYSMLDWAPATELTAKVDQATGEVVIEESIKVLTYEDLLAIPAPKWWVHGLLKQSSLAILAGAGGLGKTFLALYLAVCIASGIPWFGRSVTKGKVLYVGAEGVEDFAKRLGAISDYHNIRIEAFKDNMRFVEAGVNLSDNDSMDAFAKVLSEYEFDVIILDTFSQLTSVQNENDASQVSAVLKVKRKLRALKPGSTILTIHHAGKESGRYRGSSAMRDNVDTLISIFGTSKGFALSTHSEDSGKQRSGEPIKLTGFELVPHQPTGSAVVAQTGASVKTAANSAWVTISALLADGKPRTLKDIANDADLSYETVKDATRAVRESGPMVAVPNTNPTQWTVVPTPGD